MCMINKGVAGKILFVLDASQRQSGSPPKMSLSAVLHAHQRLPAPLPSIERAPLDLRERGFPPQFAASPCSGAAVPGAPGSVWTGRPCSCLIHFMGDIDSSDLPEPLQSEQPDSHACCSDVLRWPSSGVDGHLCDVFLPLYSLPRQQCLCSVTYGVEYPFGQFRVAALVLFPPAPCALTPPQRKASVGS